MGKSPGKSPEKTKDDDVVTAYPTAEQTYNQPQQMYPPPYHPHAYPNPYQPHPAYPNPYYYHHDSQPFNHESNATASFGRVLLMLMLIAISSVLMISTIMWFLFGSSIPSFEVASVTVSNFTATNTSFSGKWSVAMWISNVNVKVDVDFQHGMSSIFYRDSLLGFVALDPFVVRTTQRFGLNYTVPALRPQDDQKLQSWVLPSLADDRRQGAVVFSLGLAVDANFTSRNEVYRKESLRVLCEEMKIKFSSPTGDGTWSPELGNPCFIRLRERQHSSMDTS